jgi:hypothetical protein
VTPLSEREEKFIRVHITTDRSIPGAIIGILFSGEVQMSNGRDQLEKPFLKGSAISQVNWGGPLTSTTGPVPNSVGITINAPSVFVPGEELLVPVKSKADVHVVRVLPITAKNN